MWNTYKEAIIGRLFVVGCPEEYDWDAKKTRKNFRYDVSFFDRWKGKY